VLVQVNPYLLVHVAKWQREEQQYKVRRLTFMCTHPIVSNL
jgi:hypothetical protein